MPRRPLTLGRQPWPRSWVAPEPARSLQPAADPKQIAGQIQTRACSTRQHPSVRRFWPAAFLSIFSRHSPT